MDSPAVSDVRKTCDGKLFVSVSYTGKQEATSFPLVLEHEETAVRPPTTDFTANPDISNHWNGFSYDAEYTYAAIFYFTLSEPWTNDVNLRYVIPDDGTPLSTKIDLTPFAKDEGAYESSVGKP